MILARYLSTPAATAPILESALKYVAYNYIHSVSRCYLDNCLVDITLLIQFDIFILKPAFAFVSRDVIRLCAEKVRADKELVSGDDQSRWLTSAGESAPVINVPANILRCWCEWK